MIVLSCLGGLLVGYWLFLYLSVPRFTFHEGRPFHGEKLYNPYRDMDPDQWKQYHFHCHSRRYFGLTNGRLSKEKDIDSIYEALGYDHYGISDYMRINAHGSDRPGYIPAYEHGYGFFRKTHQLCIGAETVVTADFPFAQNLETKQHTLNMLGEHCRFAVPAHASFTKGYKVRDMRYLGGYRLLEILNPYGNAVEYWDAALSTGHRVYAIGDDDAHNVLNPNEVGRHFTMINTTDLDPEHVYEALDKGCAYAVDFHIYWDKPFELKVERMHQLPHLTRCELVGDTLVVETSAKRIEIAEFIGQDGKVLKHIENVTRASYVIQPEDTYVRVMMQLPNLTFFYLNPITRHTTPTPIDQETAEINWPLTVMCYLVYLLVIVAVGVRIRRQKTGDRRQKTEVRSEEEREL